MCEQDALRWKTIRLSDKQCLFEKGKANQSWSARQNATVVCNGGGENDLHRQN